MEEPPNILDALMAYFQELQDHIVPYATAGLGLAAIMLPYQFGMIFVVYGAMAVGVVPGLMLEDENVLILGMVGFPFLAIFAITAVVNLITIPMHASMLRAISKHQGRAEDDETPTELGFRSCFSTATDDVFGPLVYFAIHMLIYLCLVSLCVLPGLLFIVATDFAWPLVVLEGKKPFDAIKRSAAHFRDHLAWHMGYVLILFSIAFVLAYIPLIGFMLSPGIVGGWRLYAYSRVRDDLVAA